MVSKLHTPTPTHYGLLIHLKPNLYVVLSYVAINLDNVGVITPN